MNSSSRLTPSSSRSCREAQEAGDSRSHEAPGRGQAAEDSLRFKPETDGQKHLEIEGASLKPKVAFQNREHRLILGFPLNVS
ncbi:unnamed protein product [Linum tenue]|uniref:Uncharacterized protein n=1 Tax=Linum tenue TaxID=586396 RepID=A0AAV0N6Z5_9ROSI|nr:unnamed protein product [Linum tenue]